MFFFFLMHLRPPRSTRTVALFPYPTLLRSARQARVVQRQEGDAVAAVRGHVAQFVLLARGPERRRRAPFGAFPFDRRRRLEVARGAFRRGRRVADDARRSDEQTSGLQSLMRRSYAVFCLKKKNDYMQRHH